MINAVELYSCLPFEGFKAGTPELCIVEECHVLQPGKFGIFSSKMKNRNCCQYFILN